MNIIKTINRVMEWIESEEGGVWGFGAVLVLFVIFMTVIFISLIKANGAI